MEDQDRIDFFRALKKAKVREATARRHVKLELDEDNCNEEEASNNLTSMDLPVVARLRPPMSRLATPLPKPEGAADFAASVQRKKVKAYHVGDVVEIWSAKHKKWIKDAEVIDTVKEKCYKDGVNVRAGSVKVLYNTGEHAKWEAPQYAGERVRWLAPQQLEGLIRPSLRPRTPEVVCGMLQKECRSRVTWCSDVTYRLPMHVELCRGYLQWWEEKAAAVSGTKSQGHVYLLDMHLWRQDGAFKLRAEGGQGASFCFWADSEQEERRWVDALWEHAGYCRSLQVSESNAPHRKAHS